MIILAPYQSQPMPVLWPVLLRLVRGPFEAHARLILGQHSVHPRPEHWVRNRSSPGASDGTRNLSPGDGPLPCSRRGVSAHVLRVHLVLTSLMAECLRAPGPRLHWVAAGAARGPMPPKAHRPSLSGPIEPGAGRSWPNSQGSPRFWETDITDSGGGAFCSGSRRALLALTDGSDAPC